MRTFKISIFSVCCFLLTGLCSCSFDASGLDRLPKGCGNGVLEEGEACDDGNRVSSDGCDAACAVETGWTCTVAGCTPICGDGRILGMEQCDDGATAAGDGCDAECRVEAGWYCEDVPSTCVTRCGDGVRAGQEMCDDGNLAPSDGCSDLCRVETGFSCEGSLPSVCSPVCGDNLVVAGEVCDGVNLDGKTCGSFGFYQGVLGCMSDCRHFDQANCMRTCGDGVLDADFGEACDTDAFDPGDTCVSAGYPGGEMGCSGTCELDFASCRNWLEVAGGEDHTCALRSDGTVWCWGGNLYGQLGQPASNPSYATRPLQVPSGGVLATAVVTGYSHTCAITADRTLWCWGANTSGQLGNGQTVGSSVPVQVMTDADRPLENVVRAAAGRSHTCALTDAGAVYCWGSNFSGQLGNGTNTDQHYAAALPTLSSSVADLSAGEYHACALKVDGTAWCWGSNTYGQVGVTGGGNETLPVSVDWGTSVPPMLISVSCGESFTCVASSAGAAYCFGNNIYGQLGNGGSVSSSRPVTVSLTDPVQGVAGGGSHACAVLQNGSLQCWGMNLYGQLGDGTQTQRTSPVPVLNLAGANRMDGGKRHTCAVADGKLFCWGANSQGQVGDGSYTDRVLPVPVDVSSM